MLWLTRIGKDGELASRLFGAAGFETFHQPIFNIQPLPISPAIVTQVLSLDDYSGVVFISKTAVELGVGIIDQYWPQLPAYQHWCGMGSSSAAMIKTTGMTPVEANPPDSEGLLSQPELTDVAGQKWLIIRGEGGRELIKNELERRGARVDYLELYRRRVPDLTRVEAMLKSRQLSAIVVASTQAINELSSLSFNRELKNLVLVVPGARAAVVAAEQGFTRIVESRSATNEDLLDAYKAYMRDNND